MSTIYNRIRNIEIEANRLLEPFRYYSFVGKTGNNFYQNCRLCNEDVLDKIENLLQHLKDDHNLTFDIPQFAKGND